MAQIRICDRCKNEIDTDQEWFKIKVTALVYLNTPTGTKEKTFDLCPDCCDAILEILNNGDACIHFVDERKEI